MLFLDKHIQAYELVNHKYGQKSIMIKWYTTIACEWEFLDYIFSLINSSKRRYFISKKPQLRPHSNFHTWSAAGTVTMGKKVCLKCHKIEMVGVPCI